MTEPNREDAGVEAFEVDYEGVDEGDVPEVTNIHLVEKWGTGHPPNDRIRRRTLSVEDRATPDTNGGYVVYSRGFVTIENVTFEIKEMAGPQVPDNYDDVEEGDTRWWLRRIPWEDGHEDEPIDYRGDVDDGGSNE